MKTELTRHSCVHARNLGETGVHQGCEIQRDSWTWLVRVFVLMFGSRLMPLSDSQGESERSVCHAQS